MNGPTPLFAFRASILHFLSDPGQDGSSGAVYLEDGLLVIEDGKVRSVGPARVLLPALQPGTSVTDYSGALIVPGFIDSHVHYAQTDVIASGGESLLDWLERYIYPAERGFGDPVYARAVADFFLDELLRNGTTTALVFGTVHRQSVDAFFEAAAARNLRMVAGKALMDRHCPEYLRDTPASGYRESSELLERWAGAGRLGYAITPRFAGTSSPEQLALAGKLAREHPTAHIHSHVAENVEEVRWVRELYPDHRSYLNVYESHGLLRQRAVYAHCIHLDAEDRRRLARSGAAAAFCPTANLFLGSGLFDLEAADDAGFRVGIGTDIGAGTSFSMLRTLAEAYKVVRMTGQRLSATRAFYLATLGGAKALSLEDRIGSFLPGREADFIVLDPAATPLAARRVQAARTLEEKLLILMTLGDERSVRQTYVLGRAVPASR